MRALKAAWEELRHAPPGERFADAHCRLEHLRSPWSRVLVGFAVLVSTVIGIILAFIPGPAILFFAISAALLASQSMWLARHLDRGEMWLRQHWQAYRSKRAAALRKRDRHAG